MKRVIAWLLQIAHHQFTGSVTIHIDQGKVTFVEQRRRRSLGTDELPEFDPEFSGERLVRVEDGSVKAAEDVETIRMQYAELPLPLENGELSDAIRA